MDGQQTHVVNVTVTTTTYDKGNPYDKVPAHNGKPSWVLMATDDVKDVLGWPKDERKS